MNESGFGRGEYSPLTNEARRGAHAALLVDFDNVTLGIRSDLQKQLKLIMTSDVIRGKISVRRAYADWRRYPQYIVPLSEASFDLIFAPAFGASKKNATDIRLAIDAVELVFARPEIGTYILLSGDSDFSSLVLKLKEYGKYVIGVGIRESASDLLIQNCDEYYSYSELTGFKREGEDEEPQRDPWTLAVEATVQMRERGDVMRSDRLKQVMQELDTKFTEKAVGYNKFSRFVVECAKRGLLKVSKLENGQYEIELGRNANVEPSVEAMLTAADGLAPPSHEPAAPLNLSDAFDALKKVLQDTPPDNGAFRSDDVRERLTQRFGQNPVFEGTRFNRLLRQAHDAELIELARDDRSGYLLRLAGAESVEPETTPGKERATQTPKKKAARKGTARKTKKKATRADAAGETVRKSERAGKTKKTATKPTAKKRGKKAARVADSADQGKEAPTPQTPADGRSSTQNEESGEGEGADGSLLRRVSAVVNRAIRGDQDPEAG